MKIFTLFTLLSISFSSHGFNCFSKFDQQAAAIPFTLETKKQLHSLFNKIEKKQRVSVTEHICFGSIQKPRIKQRLYQGKANIEVNRKGNIHLKLMIQDIKKSTKRTLNKRFYIRNNHISIDIENRSGHVNLIELNEQSILLQQQYRNVSAIRLSPAEIALRQQNLFKKSQNPQNTIRQQNALNKTGLALDEPRTTLLRQISHHIDFLESGFRIIRTDYTQGLASSQEIWLFN